MIHVINDIPHNVAGFRATGIVTRADYERAVVPVTEGKLHAIGEINFLLVVDTDISNFTFGAWARDLLLGIEHLTKWNRAAIVTDSKTAIDFTDGFSYFVPGEFKGFYKKEYDAAVKWVAGENNKK